MAGDDVYITGYLVDQDDDVISDDALVAISSAGTLVLLGTDTLQDVAISGSGRVSLRGAVNVDDGLAISGAIQFVNSDMMTVDDGALLLGQSSLDSVIARNVKGATLNLSGGAGIVGAGESELVNIGAIFQTGGLTEINANFYDRGGSIVIGGTLDLDSPGDVNRIINGQISGAGVFEGGDDVVIAGSTTIATAGAYLATTRVLGDLSISSSSADFAFLNLGGGAVVSFTGSLSAIRLGEIIGSGTVDIKGADDTLLVSDALLVGDVAFVNGGKTTFTGGDDEGISFSTKSWSGDQVTIENAGGATWIDTGLGSTFKAIAATGTSLFINNGSFIEATTTGATFDMAVQNTGVMEAIAGVLSADNQSSNLVFNDALTGTGTVEVGAYNVTLNNSVSVNQKLNFDALSSDFASPTLILNDPQDFSASITGFGQDDQIELNSTTWKYEGYQANTAGTGGSLILSNAGGAELAFRISGTFAPTDIHATISGNTTTITG